MFDSCSLLSYMIYVFFNLLKKHYKKIGLQFVFHSSVSSASPQAKTVFQQIILFGKKSALILNLIFVNPRRK